jgi:hypothetical protein
MFAVIITLSTSKFTCFFHNYQKTDPSPDSEACESHNSAAFIKYIAEMLHEFLTVLLTTGQCLSFQEVGRGRLCSSRNVFKILSPFRTHFMQLYVRMNCIYSSWRWKCVGKEGSVSCFKALNEHSYLITEENMEFLT